MAMDPQCTNMRCPQCKREVGVCIFRLPAATDRRRPGNLAAGRDREDKDENDRVQIHSVQGRESEQQSPTGSSDDEGDIFVPESEKSDWTDSPRREAALSERRRARRQIHQEDENVVENTVLGERRYFLDGMYSLRELDAICNEIATRETIKLQST